MEMAPKMLTSKRRKRRRKEVKNDGGSIDRMSSLPDSVLCHILSFLPTKTAVSTMTLVSRKWLRLWQHLQVFDFDEQFFYSVTDPERFEKFSLFVNAVFSFRKSRDTRMFQLTCDLRTSKSACKFGRDSANMWLRAAINPNLQQLSLSITDYYFHKDVVVPHSLLNCTNLVSLSLVGALKMNVQHFDLHFPSLKYLKLDEDIVDSEFVLLSACPNLETLHHVCFVPRTWTQVAVPPSSERLNFTDATFSWTSLQVDYYSKRSLGLDYYTKSPLGVDCYDTEFLGFLDRTRKTTLGIIGNLQSMVEACIHFFSSQITEFVDPILNDLQAPSMRLDIQLRHSTSKCSLRPRILNYPEFRNLVHLKFILPCFNTNLIVNVLDKCRMIKGLIIQSNQEEQSPLRTWDPESTEVPKCVKSRLKYIRIEGYQGFEDELTFAEYILRNGLVLETMLIFVDTSMEQTDKYCFLKRLADIPRGSMFCQLIFDPTVSS